MKILLLSDIHGNFPALEAVARQVELTSFDLVCNCGDSTVYAPFPNETINWLRHHKAHSIRGNTDDKVIKLIKGKSFKKPSKPEKRIMYTSTAESLTKENRSYLLGLKKKKRLHISGHILGLFHGSPADHDEFLFANTPDVHFAMLAEAGKETIVVTGHSHSPYHKHIKGVHFINPGSIGRMFDSNPEASYAILSLTAKSVKVKHFRCPYNINKVTQAIRKMKLPPIYCQMYQVGRKLN